MALSTQTYSMSLWFQESIDSDLVQMLSYRDTVWFTAILHMNQLYALLLSLSRYFQNFAFVFAWAVTDSMLGLLTAWIMSCAMWFLEIWIGAGNSVSLDVPKYFQSWYIYIMLQSDSSPGCGEPISCPSHDAANFSLRLSWYTCHSIPWKKIFAF